MAATAASPPPSTAAMADAPLSPTSARKESSEVGDFHDASSLKDVEPVPAPTSPVLSAAGTASPRVAPTAAPDAASSKALDDRLLSENGINILLSRLKQSLASARDFAAFLKERSALEEKQALGLRKLSKLHQESARSHEMRQGTFSRSYIHVALTQDHMAGNGLAFAQSLMQIHEELNELTANIEKNRKTWKHEGLDNEKRVKDAESAMEKAKTRYDSLAENYDRVRTGDSSGRVFGIKGPKSAEQREADLRDKTENADSEYSSKVDAAQATRQKNFDTLRPKAIRALQELIKECDSALTLKLQEFVHLSERLIVANGIQVSPIHDATSGTTTNNPSMREVVQNIDNDADFFATVLSHPVPAAPSAIQYLKHPAMAPKTTPVPKPAPSTAPPTSSGPPPTSSSFSVSTPATAGAAATGPPGSAGAPSSPRISDGPPGALSLRNGPPGAVPPGAGPPGLNQGPPGGGLGPPGMNHQGPRPGMHGGPPGLHHQGPPGMNQGSPNNYGGPPRGGSSGKPPYIGPGPHGQGPPGPYGAPPRGPHMGSPTGAPTLPQISGMGPGQSSFTQGFREDGPRIASPPPASNAPRGPNGSTPLPSYNPVFGLSLDALFRRDESAVPLVVYQCIQAVEMFGLEVEGIYRLSGSQNHINNLKAQFNHDPHRIDFRNPSSFHHDINSVAGLLKQFFRELPDPLFTREHYGEFIDAARIDDPTLRRDSLHAVINALPDPNYATLRALTLHLARIMEKNDINRMTSANLGIVFAPTLMGQHNGNMADSGLQARVLDTILQNTYQIFDDD